MKITNLIFSNDGHISVRILVLSGVAWLPLVILTLIYRTFMVTDWPAFIAIFAIGADRTSNLGCITDDWR